MNVRTVFCASWIAATTLAAFAPASAQMGEAMKRQADRRRELRAAAATPANPHKLPTAKQQKAGDKQFIEGHWHGMELGALAPALRRNFDIPAHVSGLLIDEVNLEAAENGFLAGDVVTGVNGVPVTTLREFLDATILIEHRREVPLQVWRSRHTQGLTGDRQQGASRKAWAQDLAVPIGGGQLTLVLKAAPYYKNLGFANMDGAPPIMPGAISPHAQRSRPCTDCHLIMNLGGQLAMDAGDILPTPGPIRITDPMPHGDRGACVNCHQIIGPGQAAMAMMQGRAVARAPARPAGGWPTPGQSIPPPPAPTTVVPDPVRTQGWPEPNIPRAQPAAVQQGWPLPSENAPPSAAAGAPRQNAQEGQTPFLPQAPADATPVPRLEQRLDPNAPMAPDPNFVNPGAGMVPTDLNEILPEAPTGTGPVPRAPGAPTPEFQPAAAATPEPMQDVREPAAWLGLDVVTVDKARAWQNGRQDPGGVLIRAVAPKSPAMAVGLLKNDIITKTGAIRVRDAQHFKAIVAPMRPGDQMTITIARGTQTRRVSFILGKRPTDMMGGKQHFGVAMVAVVGIFLFTYALVFSDVLGHLTAFLIGAGLAAFAGTRFGFYTPMQMIKAINYDILIFIAGMNVVSAVLLEAGLVNYLSKRLTLATKGEPWKILLFFSILTYVVSCVMDNIATILILVPIVLMLTRDLNLNPKPVLITMVISSNLGGASTMTGDFPNMLIGLSTAVEFHDFIFYEMPACIILLVALLCYVRYVSKEGKAYMNGGKDPAILKPYFEKVSRDMKTAITHPLAAKKGIGVLSLVILGFLMSGFLGINPAYIALMGGVVLFAICGLDRKKVLRHVGAKDMIFFTCLFIMVGAADHSGMLILAGDTLVALTEGHLLVTALSLMYMSAILCAFMNAGPTAAVMIPVIQHTGIEAPHWLLWWSLSLGIVSGSSALLTAASGGPLTSTLVHKFWEKNQAVLKAKGSALRNLRESLSFKNYAMMGVPVMMMFLVINSVYITILFLLG